MDFVLVTPEALRGHWGLIKPSLEAVQAKSPEDWICEDVYHAIKAGEASCHLVLNDQGYAGLLVTMLQHTAYSRQPELHVWIAHNVGETDVFEAGLGLIRQMASACGATKITFGSSRFGWAKRFKLQSATYEVPLK